MGDIMESNPNIGRSMNERHILVDCFLVCYNGLQIMGWSCLFIHMLLFSNEHPLILWQNLQITLILVTSFLILEFFYSVFNIVRSNCCSVFLLIVCRLIIVWGVLMSALPALHNTGLILLILGWSLQEGIRYLFYCLHIMDCLPYMMIWLRYSAFVILHPLGTLGELICIYAAQEYFKQFKKWHLDLPEPWDCIFSYRAILIFLMIMYIPVFPCTYFHLISKRKKVLKRFKMNKQQSKSGEGLI